MKMVQRRREYVRSILSVLVYWCIESKTWKHVTYAKPSPVGLKGLKMVLVEGMRVNAVFNWETSLISHEGTYLFFVDSAQCLVI